MTIDFTCQKCDSSFELDVQDLIDGTEKLVCPNCDAKASASMVDDFAAAVVDLRTQVAALAKKFAVNLAIETEDLEDVASDKEEDEEEEESEEDDELDFDEDNDDVEEEEDEAEEA